MKKIFVISVIIFSIFACSQDDEKTVDCSAIDCFGGDIIQIVFLKNNQNVLEIDPNTEIRILQNNEPASINVNTMINQVSLFLIEDSLVTISINDQQFNMEIFSTFVERDCCSGIQVDRVSINGAEICKDHTCNEVLEINLD